MKNILFIHQSADLYGSDKTLLSLVQSIRDTYNPIVIVPNEGPLTEELFKENIEFYILPVIKVSRQIFTNFQIVTLPFQAFETIRKLKRILGERKIDLIHSNTLAVFLGAFYSKIFKIKHIWHIHEIIEHPKFIAKMYSILVNRFSDFVVYNSNATANHYNVMNPKLKLKSKIIYNGLKRDVPFLTNEEKNLLRKSLFKSIDEKSIIIGLVGRFNKIKGQRLLLNVFENLVLKGHSIYLLYIGSAIKSQHYLLDELTEEINNKSFQNSISILDFQKDLWKYYDCMDILIVPSISPESFGLVALEAMLSKKPVIASNLGGLKEIIIQNETGLLFETPNESELQKAIEKLIVNRELINAFGNEGEKRAVKEFSLSKYYTNFKALYSSF